MSLSPIHGSDGDDEEKDVRLKVFRDYTVDAPFCACPTWCAGPALPSTGANRGPRGLRLKVMEGGQSLSGTSEENRSMPERLARCGWLKK